MKLSCKVIEDILPMYYDGVCSDESAVIVEEHLKVCPQCSGVLADLHTELELGRKTVDNLKPLESISKKWKRSKGLYIGRGICIALAALLVVALVLTGIWYFSYARYWYELADVMDTAPKEEHSSSIDYVLLKNGFRFDMNIPAFLSNSGFVRVMDSDGLVIFFYPETGGSYSFWLYITDQDNEAYSVHLKSDMTPDFENYQFPVRSEPEKQKITQLLADKNDAVAAMLDEIQSLWGIDLLKFTFKN